MKIALVLALVACSKTTKVSDDCRTIVDKSRTVMAEMAKSSGGKPVTVADEDKLIERCHDALANGKREATMDCILAAKDDDAVRACVSDGLKGYGDNAKLSEARIMLKKVGMNAKMAYVEKDQFPIGKAALTPVVACCKQPGARCAPTAADWALPAWQALNMSVDEPFRFQYSYESDGKTFTASATGDADCDGHAKTMSIHGAIESGNVRITDSD
jgi:hypothetical protein